MQLDTQAALAFIHALGRDPSTVRLRAFPHTDTPKERKAAIGPGKHEWGDRAGVEASEARGRGLYMVINVGGDTKESITELIAYFAEFDDIPRDQQLAVVAEKMPPASLIVDTGGDSLHFYWLLKEPVPCSPAKDCPIKRQWQDDQKRIAKYLDSDGSINDPNRVMRLPGAIYFDATQQPVGRAAIVHQGGERYSREEVLAGVPAAQAALAVSAGGGGGRCSAPVSTSSTDKAIRQAAEQLSRVPQRIPGSKTRHVYLRLLWALVDLAGPAEAARMFTQHSPAWAEAEDLAALAQQGSGDLKASSFFHVVKQEWGITRPARTTTRTRRTAPMPPAADQSTHPLATGGRCSAPAAPPTAAQLDKPAADAFRRDIKQHLDESNSNAGADFQVFVTDKAIEHNLTSYQAEAIIRELRKDDDVTTEADAGIAKVKADIAAWEYRRNELKLDILLPRALHAPIRFVMESIPGSDELSAGMAYLGCMSGVLKTGTLIRADYRSFVVPPSLYLAFIGKSGLGKSPTIREIGMRSLDLVQRNYNEINRQRLADWEVANAGVKRSEQAEKPRPVLMTMADYTGEFLGSLLATHEPLQLGHLISCDELSQVFRSLNAYKTAGKGGEEQQLLSLFDGRGSATGRVTTGISRFDYAQFSIIGGLQPRVFDQLAASGDPGGLYARMLMIKCDEANVLRDPVEPPETIARYRQQLDIMQDVALKASLLQPKQYMLSDDAMRQLAQIAFDSREHARYTDLDEHSSIYGKRATQVIRLAGLTHVACVAAGELPPDSKISSVAIRNAADVVAHLHEYALDTQARAHDTGADAWLVESILRNTATRQLTAAKYRNTYLAKNKRSMYSIQAIDKIMRDLAAQGLGRIVPSSSHRARDGDSFTAQPLQEQSRSADTSADNLSAVQIPVIPAALTPTTGQSR